MTINSVERFFYVFNEEYPFISASVRCKGWSSERFGWIASIKTNEELAAIEEHIDADMTPVTATSLWVGLSRAADWAWINGMLMIKFVY